MTNQYAVNAAWGAGGEKRANSVGRKGKEEDQEANCRLAGLIAGGGGGGFCGKDAGG